jgi:asparagine synthase (glutamine-hydrolysing)
MDSTAIALLARDALPADAAPLAALSLTYDSLPGLDIEKPYLDLALAQPGLVPYRIPGDDRLDFDVFHEPPPHDEPHSGLFRAGLDVALLEAAGRARADTVMTGFGADEMLASAPFYLADLLKAGRVREAWREAARWSHAHTCNPWRFFWPFAVRPLLPLVALTGLAPRRPAWRRQSAATIPPWVLPQFAREGRLRERALAHLRHNFRGHRSVVLAEALARIRLTSGDWARATLAAPAGIHISHPFRDPRVLALGLGIRARVRPVPLQQKIVLARAMNGVLPRAIIERRAKSHFNALYYRGLARHRPYLEEMVRASAVDEHGLFDKDLLSECLRDAAAGGQTMDGVIGLNNTLAIVRWLALLPQWLRDPAS